MGLNIGLLNALLSRTGMTKKGFAEKYGFKPDTLNKWTYGVPPNAKNMQRLADVFGVSVDFLQSDLDEVQMMARQTALMKWSMEHIEGEREIKDEHAGLFDEWINDKADRERSSKGGDTVASPTGASPLERPVEAVPSRESTLSPEQQHAELAASGDNT